MKKFIAIALIAIVALTAAFAETGRVKVTYSVTDSEPTFSLETGSIKITAGDTSTKIPTADSSTAVSEALADGTDGEVAFKIRQSGGRSHMTYTLTVTVGNLILTANGEQISNPATNQQFTAKAFAGFTADSTGATNLTIDATTNKDKVTAAYNGKVLESGVAEFKAQWNANTTAEAGNYLAYVTLTVSSN